MISPATIWRNAPATGERPGAGQPNEEVDMSELTAEERFWAKVDPFGDCWEWTGAKNSEGYGTFYIGRVAGKSRSARAHRWVWEHLVGPIPHRYVVDHLCRNTSCVNPDHLEPVTRAENTFRGYTIAADNVAKTHCPKGHKYDAADKPTAGRGPKRYCRQCLRDRQRARYWALGEDR